MNPQGPDPFQRARAHTWPEGDSETKAASSPTRVKQLLAVGSAFVLVCSFLVFRAVSGGSPDPTPTLATPTGSSPPPSSAPVAPPPTSTTPSAPPASVTGSPPVSSSTPPGVVSAAPPAARPRTPRQFASLLLNRQELAGLAPGGWSVAVERVDAFEATPYDLVDCRGTGRFGDTVVRLFQAGPGALEASPRIAARVGINSPLSGAPLVQALRRTVATCPTREVDGGFDRYSILVDEPTVDGERLIVRRQPNSPRGTYFGTDYIVIRRGEVVMTVDVAEPSAPSLAMSRSVLQRAERAMCRGLGCA